MPVTTLVSHILAEFEKVSNVLSKLIASSTEAGDHAPSDQPADVQPGDGAHRGTRVLLVEDSLVNQEIATDVLESAGCTVAIANDGNEAIEADQTATFDIVFMDCQMSGMDGFNATKGIRYFERRSAHVRTPIVALTAHALIGDCDLCIASEMDDYLSKPFTSEDLLAMLLKWRRIEEAAATADDSPDLAKAGSSDLQTSHEPSADAA